MSSTTTSTTQPSGQPYTTFYVDPGLYLGIGIILTIIASTTTVIWFLSNLKFSIRDGDNKLETKINETNTQVKGLITEVDRKLELFASETRHTQENLLLRIESKDQLALNHSQQITYLQKQIEEIKKDQKSKP